MVIHGWEQPREISAEASSHAEFSATGGPMRNALVSIALTLTAACGDPTAPMPTAPPDQQGDAEATPPLVFAVPDAGPCDATYDPCSPSPCFSGVECTVEDQWKARCAPCPEGMMGDGFDCAEPPRLEIHEIDYDQPGADTLEFVELSNVGAHAADTEGFVLEFVNGDGSIYRRVALDALGPLPPGALALVASKNIVIPEDVPVVVTGSSAIIQNGPDGLRVVDREGYVLDEVAYGGAVEEISPEAHVDLVDAGPGSLGRLSPGGPYVVSCEPTPGSPNTPPCD